MTSLLAACAVSSLSNPFRAGDSEDPPLASGDQPLPAANVTGSSAGAADQSLHCPQVVSWPHERLLTVYQPGQAGDSQSIIHRGEITKLARECQILGDRIVVKYGFAGRVMLGPKGKPGPVSMPVAIKVADADRRVLARDAERISTVIPQENPVGYFSVVKEISFPIMMGTRAEDYKVFVGFQQAGAG